MRLEDYWGVGPKTAERLETELGVEAAIEAIEAADSRRLVAAGLSRGRATRILRRADGGAGMDVLATRDAREVYKELLELAADHALTAAAADSIRVLTPLPTREAMAERLADVREATDSWERLDADTVAAVEAAYEEHDAADGDRAAVETALALQEAGVEDGVFEAVAALDGEALADAAAALAAFDGAAVSEGVDDELDALRETLAAVEEMNRNPTAVLDAVRSEGLGDTGAFRTAFRRHVVEETGLSSGDVREATPDDAVDAPDFVAATLRALVENCRERVTEREETVAADLRETVEETRDTVDAAAEVVETVALRCSLARFALAYDLVAPALLEDDDVLAVADARNLDLLAAEADVQPVDYAVGDHSLPELPDGDRVAVLTGANSGGKTTLLETLCQVTLLAHMGLPVPAAAAEVGVVDTVVFHRRHASFNAGVLEATLDSIVPPLAGEGRTLMLVDEFEAITEPGSAADLLHGLVGLTVDRDALGVFVTHLAEDLRPLPSAARTDGIFAEGLDPELELLVDYQPRFDTVGRSTPEFIVSRLVADAGDRAVRQGFERLAEAVGEEAVQRTLADARWT
jgi:DNA mismatch repair protein MutS2